MPSIGYNTQRILELARDLEGFRTLSYPSLVYNHYSYPNLRRDNIFCLKIIYQKIIENIEQVGPFEYKVILKGTYGENNSNFDSKEKKRLFNNFKKNIPLGIKITCYDKYENKVEIKDES